VPIAMTQEQRALQASLRDWAKRTAPVAVARQGASTALLADLAALGVFAIPLDGGTVTDLAAALEQLAGALAPGPVLPTALASLLLARSGQEKLLPARAQAQATACVALDPGTPGTLTGTRQADGGLRVTGETGPVLWAAGHLLASAQDGADGDAWFLLDQDQPGVTIENLTPLDFSRELAAVRLADAVIPPENLLPGLRTESVRDLAATLYAAEAAGVAAWCSGTAADYANTRRQFGRPIGQFQAVKHLCATMACRAERAAALAWDAARAADDSPAEHPLAAAAAAALALDDAVDNAKDCIQVLGGIGFTWEHDAHLYLRRALALRQLLGGSPAWRTRAATLAATAARKNIPTAQPAPATSIGEWAGPAIARYGTAEQQERFLGPTQRAEITWCQLFSEPEAGSDLASLRTRAERVMGVGPGGTGGGSPPGTEKVGGGWRLTGQKVWTSLAREADWAICLARTDPDVPKHEGITFFLVNMHVPGIDIRPLREITGRAVFNEVFLDDVLVPDCRRLDAEGNGWKVALTTLSHERGAMGNSAFGGAGILSTERLIGLVQAMGKQDDPVIRDEFGELLSHLRAARYTQQVMAAQARSGEAPGPEIALNKIALSNNMKRLAEFVAAVLGPALVADTGAWGTYAWTSVVLGAPGYRLGGGTDEVLKNAIAQRVLGLPRPT
jgi:3-oxochol-4-en-24-oyl-CoA dehydrogenase